MGFAAAIDGASRRDVVELALTALARLEHRGGLGAGGQASDGAGVLTAIPWDVLRPWLDEHGPAGAGELAGPWPRSARRSAWSSCPPTKDAGDSAAISWRSPCATNG